MDVWTFLRVSSFLTYIGLATFLVIRNSRSAVNRTAALFIVCLSVWSFGDIFAYFSSFLAGIDKILFVNIRATGWLCLPSVFLIFVLTFTNKEGILGLNKKFSYLPLLLIPALFIYKQYTNTLFSGEINIAKTWSLTLWQYSFYVYYLSFMGQALYVMLDCMEKTADATRKKQAKIISIATIITILSVSLINIVLPEWRITVFMRETDLIMFSMLIWASGLVYAISAYKSIGITPALILDKIISSMTDFLLLLDKKGNILNANNAVLGLLGYKKKELENMSLSMLVTDEDLKNSITERILANEYVHDREITLRRKDGKNIMALFSGLPLLHDNKMVIGIACIAKDITRQKQIEEELQESDGRYQSIITHIQDGLTVIENGKSTYMNNRVYEIFGYDQRGHLDMMSIDLAAPEERERIKPLFQKMHTEGAYPKELAYWAVTKNNDRRYIRNQYTLIKCGNASSTLLIVTADITEQKKAEESLQASEGKLRTILMNTRDIIYTAHADRTITFISPQISCLGYDTAEFIGRNLIEFMHPDDRANVRNDYERTRQIGLDFPMVYRLTAKDGTSVYFEEFSKSIKEQDAVVQVIGSLRDVSERKQMEKDKESLLNQLYQVQKMDAMGTFAAGIAHDFNNSLSAIQGFASLMLMEIDEQHP
jgi:PAS domain S-box-containing protein